MTKSFVFDACQNLAVENLLLRFLRECRAQGLDVIEKDTLGMTEWQMRKELLEIQRCRSEKRRYLSQEILNLKYSG